MNNASQRLYRFLSTGGEETDKDAFSDFFNTTSKRTGPRNKGTGGKVDPPPPEPREATITPFPGGFKVTHSPRKEQLCPVKVEFAYDSTGSPLRDYSPFDFKVGSHLEIEKNNCSLIDTGDNYLVVNPESKDYEIIVTGFDQNKDVIVSATNYTEQAVDE